MLGVSYCNVCCCAVRAGGQEQCSIMQRLHNQTKKYLIQKQKQRLHNQTEKYLIQKQKQRLHNQTKKISYPETETVPA